MSATNLKSWTVEDFFAWHERQEGRYEFDGEQPVAMVGGTLAHGLIMANLHFALRLALNGTACRVLGPDVGVATIGKAIRYPDALVTCAKLVGSAYTAPGAVAVFEIVSPTSGRNDRITKPREYAAIASLRRYVLIESTVRGATVMARERADQSWTMATVMSDEVLCLPEIGVTISLAALYQDVDFSELAPAGE